MSMTQEQAINLLIEHPYKLGHLVGFDKLGSLHNKWIRDMVFAKEDKTLQAHRGSFKTTCVSLALADIIILKPSLKTAFFRKTDTDVKEIIRQTKNVLLHEATQYITSCIYGSNIRLLESSSTAITTNLSRDTRGTSQLVGMGLGGSLTGKHFDRIFTDDIVNVNDRMSKAERDRTKLIYQEIQNVKNRNGIIFNTGTPWHKDDCFNIMPSPDKYDWKSTGLISEAEAMEIKRHMTSSLFAANYELRHIASEDVIFDNPHTGGEPELCEQGMAHVDAAYHGEDFTAFTIVNKIDGKYYVFGKLWRRHVDDVEDDIIKYRKAFNAGRIWVETNGDKGYLAKSLQKKGERVSVYHEGTNKYVKITSYLKDVWDDVIFVKGTDPQYIEQICDYNDNAEHDDAPDSLASLVRALWKKTGEQYKPIWNGGI